VKLSWFNTQNLIPGHQMDPVYLAGSIRGDFRTNTT
jgi:hypothetical protein